MKKNELKKIVKNFHDSIILIKDKFYNWEGYNVMKDFPNETCDYTCELLQIFLKNKFNLIFDIKEVLFYDINLNQNRFHQFLENNKYIIDITAYQFNNRSNMPKFDKILCLSNKEKYYFSKFKNEIIENRPNILKLEDYNNFYKEIIKKFKIKKLGLFKG